MNVNSEASELQLLLEDIKRQQKVLVAPIILCGILALQTSISALQDFRPVAVYGSVHCISILLVTLWQDVPPLEIIRQRTRIKGHVHLLLGLVGCAICVHFRTNTNDDLLKVIVLFLLPVISICAIGDSTPSMRMPLQAFLVAHFAMACMFCCRVSFSNGWRMCLLSFVFDGLIYKLYDHRIAKSEQQLKIITSTINQLLIVAFDGSCLLNNVGDVALADDQLAKLFGASPEQGWELEGLPFNTLLAPGAPTEEGGPQLGRCNTKLHLVDGRQVNVETYTIRCDIPDESLNLIMGRTKSGGNSTCQNSATYLRAVRCQSQFKESSLRERQRLPGSSSKAPSSCLRDNSSDICSQLTVNSCVSSVWRRRDGDDCSCVGSEVSNVPDAAELSSARLQLMKDRMHISARAADDAEQAGGMPLILELDLPVSETGSSVVSENTGACSVPGSSPCMARVRLPGPKRGTSRESMDSTKGNEEMVATEVLEVGAGPGGQMQMKMVFRSQLLSQQQSLLNSYSSELQSVRRDLHVRDGVQEDQKEVLRRFQKIVSREFGNVGDETGIKVGVFVFDKRAELRAKLMGFCVTLGCPCQTFSSITDGMDALHESAKTAGIELGVPGLGDPWSMTASSNDVAWSLRRPIKPETRAAAADASTSRAQLVLLGSSQLRDLPDDWGGGKVFVALMSSEQESDAVVEALRVPGKSRIRECLRSRGISEYLKEAVSLETLRRLVQAAMQRPFGDDYLLMEQLGRGASSAVYRAKRLRDGHVFALKEINVTRYLRRRFSQQDLEELWSESQVLKQLHWPTVISLHDEWFSGGGKLMYMVMPVLDGGSVAEKVAKWMTEAEGSSRSARIDQSWLWFAQTVHGLAYLHWCGLLHRDIKPENLFLAADTRSLRIGDFGTASFLPGSGPQPATGSFIKGDVTTPITSAPEVFAHGTFYAASDIWSLGVTFFEVFTLKHLLPRCQNPERYAALVQKIDLSDAGRMDGSDAGAGPEKGADDHSTSLMQKAPPAVSKIIHSMLVQDPHQRPRAASLASNPDVYEQIRKALCGSDVFDDKTQVEQHFQDLQQLLRAK